MALARLWRSARYRNPAERCRGRGDSSACAVARCRRTSGLQWKGPCVRAFRPAIPTPRSVPPRAASIRTHSSPKCSVAALLPRSAELTNSSNIPALARQCRLPYNAAAPELHSLRRRPGSPLRLLHSHTRLPQSIALAPKIAALPPPCSRRTCPAMPRHTPDSLPASVVSDRNRSFWVTGQLQQTERRAPALRELETMTAQDWSSALRCRTHYHRAAVTIVN